MGIEEVVDVQITIQDAVVTRAGFGVALVAGPASAQVGKVASYSSPEAAALVFTSPADPIIKAVNSLFAQSPRPTSVKVGDVLPDQKQKDNVFVNAVNLNEDYTITLNGVLVTHDSGGAPTGATITAALKVLLDALAQPVVVTDNGGDLDIEASVAGVAFTLAVSSNQTISNTTLNRNLATELVAIEAFDADWFGLITTARSVEDITEASDFVQARRKIYGAASDDADISDPEQHVQTLDFDADFVASNTIDMDIDGIAVAQQIFDTDQATTLAALAVKIAAHSSVKTALVTGARQITITALAFGVLMPVTSIVVALGASQANGSVTTTADPTTDIASALKAATKDRSFIIFSADKVNFPEAAWIGGAFPLDPGSLTWFSRTLLGITVDDLSDNQKSTILGKNANTYTTVGGVAMTQNGTMASGRFIDVRRGADWLTARIEEDVFAEIVRADKIPYTDAGVAIIEGAIRAVLSEAIRKNVIAASPEPIITVPKVADVASNDKANRLLPDVKFEATLAGAIHKTVIRGTVSV